MDPGVSRSRRLGVVAVLLVAALVTGWTFLHGTPSPEAPVDGQAPPRPAGGDFTPVSVRAEQGGLALWGTVKDVNGQPLAGARVSLASSSQRTLADVTCPEDNAPLLDCRAQPSVAAVADMIAGGRGGAAAAEETEADGEGRFRFEGLAGASFTVWARAPGHGAAVRERAAPGEPVALVLPPERTLRGVVEGEDGRTVPGARVTVISRRLALPVTRVAGDDGRFLVDGLGEGPFYVLGEAEGRLPAALPLVGAGPDPVRLKLLTPRVLEITVQKDGRPVEATVELSGNHLRRTARAEEGRARVEGLFPGQVSAVARAGGAASVPRFTSLQESTTRLVLDLEEAGTLRVTVVDEEGAPVPSPVGWLGSTAGEFLVERKGDGAGALELGPVARGECRVRVGADGFKSTDGAVVLTSAEQSMEVVLQRAVLIRGRVLDEYDRPAPGVSVLVQPSGRLAWSDAAGTFQATVPSPGSYTLNAHHSDWGGGTAKVEAPTDDARLQLEQRGTVEITVEYEGRTVEGADAVLWNGPQDFFRSDRASGPDGVVRMRGLPPGSYQMVASHPDHVDSDRVPLTLAEGGTVRVRVSLKEGARISGQAVDERGQPVAGAEVRLVPRVGRPVSTGLEGYFEVRGLRPGASHHVDVQHPRYAQVGRVTARAGGEPVKVTLRSRTLYRGRVVGEDGAPVTRFRVDETEVQATDGRFELPLREDAGQVIFSVQARGYEPRAVELPAQRELGDVVLSTAPRVSGLVRDEAGHPVPQALVTCDGCDESGSTGPDGRFRYAVPFLRGGMELVARRGNLEGRAALAEGQSEVVITVRGGTKLTGTAFDAQGAPLEGAEVTVYEPDRGHAGPFVTGAGGRFQAELAPGNYRFTPGGFANGPAGQVMEQHAVSGAEQVLQLGHAPGSTSLTVQLAPAQGSVLWIIPGEFPAGGYSPDVLGRVDGLKLVYEPPPLVRIPGLKPGRYTVIYAPYHVSVPGGPALVRVDVPTAEPLVLGPAAGAQ